MWVSSQRERKNMPASMLRCQNDIDSPKIPVRRPGILCKCAAVERPYGPAPSITTSQCCMQLLPKLIDETQRCSQIQELEGYGARAESLDTRPLLASCSGISGERVSERKIVSLLRVPDEILNELQGVPREFPAKFRMFTHHQHAAS